MFNFISLLAVVFLLISLMAIQEQKFRKIRECCICRQSIVNNEEIEICPDCQTIYHRTHLSLWLKIRNICPICKNRIRNHCVPFSNDITQHNLISSQRKYRVKIRSSQWGESFVFECSSCKNILNSSIYGVPSQCHMCGSRIPWIDDLESKIKNLNNSILFERKKSRRTNRKRRKNNIKISYRDINRQKEIRREVFQKKLEKQAQIESLNQMLSFNQIYSRNTGLYKKRKQIVPLRIIEYQGKQDFSRRRINSGLKTVIPLIVIILITIFTITAFYR